MSTIEKSTVLSLEMAVELTYAIYPEYRPKREIETPEDHAADQIEQDWPE